MSEQNLFNTPTEETKRLIDELRETKEALRDISKRLAQIDLRIRRSFPTLFPKQPSTRGAPSDPLLEKPTLTVDQAMQMYDDLVALAKGDEQHIVQDRLASLCLADLNLLRRELGASIGKKKPSRKVLEDAIIGRVRESVMLTRHANRDRIIQQADNSPGSHDTKNKKE